MASFKEILQQYWGYPDFRPLQEDIIRSVCEGRDTLGLMPTGGGKSITFQVPGLYLEGITLVVTPLIALMKDQVDNLKKRGIKAAAVYSGMPSREIEITLDNCIYGGYKFLYISPERLGTELFMQKMQWMKVSLLVIDEAHCISQWGYDFRPSYLKISEIRQVLSGIPVLALTATATPEVVKDIQDKLGFKEYNVFQKSFYRQNVAYVVRRTDDKLSELRHILQRVKGSTIVYTRNRRKTKEVAVELQKQGISADFFHAGLAPDIKEQKQNDWMKGTFQVMVSTNAFGMGIDKPDVRLVVHIDLPDSLEEYYQEAGRAGRDGLKSYAVALFAKSDKTTLKRRISDSFPDRDFIKKVYDHLGSYLVIGVGYGFQAAFDFLLPDFCHRYKLPLLPTHYALKLLDQSGYIEYTDEVDAKSRVMFSVHRDELYKLKQFEEADKLIHVLLRLHTGLFADFVYIHEEVLARHTEMTRDQVYQQLLWLSKHHIINYVPGKKTPFIIYTQRREESQYISIPRMVYEERKERLEKRIEAMLHYVSSETECRSQMLLGYFGEKEADRCGTCDICLKKNETGLTQNRFAQIEEEIEKIMQKDKIALNELVNQISGTPDEIISVIRYLTDRGKILQLDNMLRLAD
ncbi:ATP-dependent DNA helicase RecQ [Parabacteroides sp. FAFU027]|uniref:RecQ family ATP-dependent DNA helicase n=1 Tax=Parabacteroides sp. FAFU027 TaxID=2922715 RepID=UPI001FB02476|nr:ATP-dependent DNA helicase RecQ [Parabacteroides sp. FAFU027]